MHQSHFTRLALCAALAASANLAAVAEDESGFGKVAIHGSIQTDILFPQEDESIGTGKYSEDVLTNTYADVKMVSRYLDAGLRFEYLDHPLPGFQDNKGWGIPNFFATAKYKGFELTAGDFYEQFGSGFIFRTYEERALGIDNSLRGGRLKVNAVNGLRLTALGGVQRRYWDWDTHSVIYGADAEFNIDTYSARMRDNDISWSIGGSYILKDEKDESVIVPGTNYRLHLPRYVNAFDVRTKFRKQNFSILGEFAWKSDDPSADNDYTYRPGNAVMVSATYSKSGLSALLQAKRSENMAFRSERTAVGSSVAFLNNMPAFSYQHTYAVAALYPYATQAAGGEWAFQGNFAYSFKRRTALGGRYGTKIKVNASYIRGLEKEAGEPGITSSPMGTDGESSKFFGFGDVYYHDFNVQLEKKVSNLFSFNFMYMNQKYNKSVVEGHGGVVKSNIFVFDGKFRFNKRYTLRTELQYLTTKQDQKDWLYGMLELSVAPYLMFSVSDLYNVGDTKTHYYMAGVTGNYRANRLMIAYGRTRAGFNCSGGVCRYVEATKGFQIAYSYNF
jgi:hypothetical protein